MQNVFARSLLLPRQQAVLNAISWRCARRGLISPHARISLPSVVMNVLFYMLTCSSAQTARLTLYRAVIMCNMCTQKALCTYMYDTGRACAVCSTVTPHFNLHGARLMMILTIKAVCSGG